MFIHVCVPSESALGFSIPPPSSLLRNCIPNESCGMLSPGSPVLPWGEYTQLLEEYCFLSVYPACTPDRGVYSKPGCVPAFVWALGTHWQKGDPHSPFREWFSAERRELLRSVCCAIYRKTQVVPPARRKRTGDRR